MLIYTFRTCPFKDKLQEYFPELFVFGNLKQDMNVFCQQILEKKPKHILGIAKGDFSRCEIVAINRFNNKKINKTGTNEYKLEIIRTIQESNQPTHSFCNWTMYKIAEFIDKQNMDIKLSFIHSTKQDVDKILVHLTP